MAEAKIVAEAKIMDAPKISQPVLRFFRMIVRGYFARHFRAVRVSDAFQVKALGDGPLIVYANHSSWWDPMVLVLLATKYLSSRHHYAPMDASALERYGILKHIGVFGVEMKTARGAAQFLRTGLSVLQQGNVLWVTPQGRFADARERPLVFKPGLAALASRVKGGCTVLPLAIEYTFWDERLPETLLHFGEPLRFEGEPAEHIEASLARALETTMAALAVKSIARDPAAFTMLQQGKVGTGGFYEAGQRLVARLRGRKFQAEHTAATPLRREEAG